MLSGIGGVYRFLARSEYEGWSLRDDFSEGCGSLKASAKRSDAVYTSNVCQMREGIRDG
jgi:hypothetical protein